MSKAKNNDQLTHFKFDPNNQSHWSVIFEESDYTFEGLRNEFEIQKTWLKRFMAGETPQTAKQLEEFEKIKAVMPVIAQTQRIKFHPSFGYVTDEQREELIQLPLGSRRDKLIKLVERQNKTKGKLR
jgi:hypothetical protein